MFTDLVNSRPTQGFTGCVRGAVSPMVAIMLIPILGATALAVDVGYWYFKQRDMQSAADTAAIAAAQTPDEDEAYDGVNDDFINVAKGTAAEYGYVDGDGSVTVDATRVQCPSETDPTILECTQVVIGYTSPLFFSPIVGFSGNQNGGQGVAALAIAGDQNGGSSNEFCVVALESDPGEEGILAKGVPKGDVHGCDLFSNSDMTCTGHNLNAGNAVAVGTSSGCGTTQTSGAEPMSDPYPEYEENLSDIPNPCGAGPAPQANSSDVVKDSSGNTVSGNMISGNQTSNPLWKGTKTFCGDVVLTGNLDLSGVTLAIFDGRLITKNNKFTANNSSLVFTGNPASSAFHYPTGTAGNGNVVGSAIEISAPSSGDWNNVAVYIDPNLTTGVNIPEIGNAPAYTITGLFYAPNSNVKLNGIVNKEGGESCFIWIVNSLEIKGTGQIFADLSLCDPSFPLPGGSGTGGRPWLVF